MHFFHSQNEQQVQAACAQVGPSLKLYALWVVAIVCFIFATWEEYYTGKLTLGYVNGPSDGVLLCAIFCLMGAYSPGVWAKTFGEVLPHWFQGTW
jgi:ethanolaminephosphotransferase